MKKIDLLNLLRSSKIFSSLDDKSLLELLKQFKKVWLQQGSTLFKQGELSHNLYLLICGRIGLFLKTETKETVLINEILPGMLMGEVSALSHEPRFATAKAVKKSLVLELSSDDFIEICKKYNSVSLELINTTFSESRDIIKKLTNIPLIKNHLVVMPANKNINFKIFSERILKYSAQFPEIIILQEESISAQFPSIAELKQHLIDLDQKNKIIISLINSQDVLLNQLFFELETIDMIYIVGEESTNPIINKAIQTKIETNKYKIRAELILLHDNDKSFPKHTAKWLKKISFNLHHHIRIDYEKDWQRLLRFMTGKAVGVVMGGGGLRCWAQFGALQALKEHNIPIDAIGGASAGSIVAGFYAMNLSINDSADLRKLSAVTRETIALKNITWPATSLFNGKKYTELLHKIFKRMRIEDLWLPYFCICTNLSSSKQIVSRKGLLWKKIRSSTSVPLIFPPVTERGKINLDGGLINNLPVDVMKKIIPATGKIIAIKLTHHHEDTNKYNFPPSLPFWKTLFAKLGLIKNYKFPNLVDMFLNSLLVGNSLKQRNNSLLADLLIAPDLSKFSLLELSKNDEDQLIELGYKEAVEQIRKLNIKL